MNPPPKQPLSGVPEARPPLPRCGSAAPGGWTGDAFDGGETAGNPDRELTEDPGSSCRLTGANASPDQPSRSGGVARCSATTTPPPPPRGHFPQLPLLQSPPTSPGLTITPSQPPLPGADFSGGAGVWPARTRGGFSGASAPRSARPCSGFYQAGVPPRSWWSRRPLVDLVVILIQQVNN